MKKYFNVSFQYSETVFCSNIALAESVADVEKHYRKYNWISVTEAKEYEVETAKRKGMPIVNIDHETEPTEETAEAKQTEQQPEQAAETEEQAATTASQGTERKERKAMKKERKATPFEYMGCMFLLGISKKFDRDLETVKTILDKPELTPADRVKLLMVYSPSFHDTGKIAGSTSFDSSAGNCIFCQKMRRAAENNAGHICNYCYDMDQENRWKEVLNRHSLNMLIMQSVEFTVDELAILPATKINRINSSGDTPNKVYAKNMLNLAKANAELHFAYWAKNTRDVIAACDEIGKPENMTLVQSSYMIGKAATLAKYFDFVFTVYATEDGVKEAIERGAGECNGKKCAECGWKCYLETWKKAGVKEVAEILRTKKGTAAKLAAAGVK